MTVYAYNNNCGWKHTLTQRKSHNGQSVHGFIWSLVAALVIVFIVAELLSIIDYRIQNKSLSGFTFHNSKLISSVEAAHLNGSIVLNPSNKSEVWYVGKNSGRLHFVGTSESLLKIIKNFSITVKGNTFKSWKGVAPATYKGRFVIDLNDLSKMYFINPSDSKPYLLNGLNEGVIMLASVAVNISDKDFKAISVVKDFDKPNNFVGTPTSTTTPSSNISSNGLDVVKYCENKSYTYPQNDLERTCNRLSQERAQKVAYYESINNKSNVIAPQPTTTAPVVNTPVNNTNSLPSTSSNLNAPVAITSISDGPLIRVGLFVAESAQIIRASNEFNITDASGNKLLNVQPNQLASIEYRKNDRTYAFGIGIPHLSSSSYLRLVPVNQNSVFEIISHENRPAWNLAINDNAFRGVLELRYNSAKNRAWIINELAMEPYLKGMAETSNISPSEYLKTMAVAARTYATHHLIRNTKHANEYFTVDATYDQVYKGYNVEMRLPNLTLAVDATRGQVVTYNGNIAITPYFSWSDGRTRSMLEVWRVDHPWLQSVAEPSGYSKTTLFGHGVGLSAHGAILLASSQYRYTYDQILSYYYRGTSLSSNYNNAVSIASSP